MSLRAIQELQYAFSKFPETADHASNVHAKLVVVLAQHGYSVRTEYPVVFGNRNGRVDIRAVCPVTGTPIGIEIDARKPRKNSIRKLNVMREEEGALRIVCLRGVNGPAYPIDGVDMVYPLPVRMMGNEEKVSVAAVAREVFG